MESMYCINMHSGDYQNTSKSKPEECFSYRDPEYHRNRDYHLNHGNIQEHGQFENQNESIQTIFSQPTDHSQIQSKEYLLKNHYKSDNVSIQPFGNNVPMLLSSEKRDNYSKDKRAMQIRQVGDKNVTLMPSGKYLRSRSAPSIPILATKQYLSGDGNDENKWPEGFFTNDIYPVVQPETVDSTLANLQSSCNERNQEMKTYQKSRNATVKKRQDPRGKIKNSFKKFHATENSKLRSHDDSLDSVNEIKYLPYRRNSEETDIFSSYSESDLRYISKQVNPANERVKLDSSCQQSFQQNLPGSSRNDNIKYISNALRPTNFNLPLEESFYEKVLQKTESRFTTDSFLRKELSDFKEFLIYRRKKRRQRTNRKQNIPTVCIPESYKPQKRIDNRMAKKDNIYGKEHVDENRRKRFTQFKPHLPIVSLYCTPGHKRRRPKVSEEELWKRFEHNFKSFATTRRYSGEVISRKISTEWMSYMGVVDDILTEKDADTAFKKAAGPKITMNIHEYKEFLITVTMRKKLPFYEIYRRMCGI